ncbi:FtsX-like permease family protein [Streptosporangium sp. NBC_01756]|uniref:FtsX-like permease family protein n=1 Tax=Streptosporangium sp. NBC_01756 TaxID=2975950 RepID=UPI002DDC5C00|nr:FtsX-like permease family protein [Streptosporangium sp. NBC_01756]WSC88647.1 FtsX-like permease family protein [Streptosporangium sp. NBC_01756]
MGRVEGKGAVLMWRLALSSLQHRLGAFTATFVAMALGVAIVSACGGLMETGIRLDIPPQRLASAPIVVTGDQSYILPRAPAAPVSKTDEDEEEEEEETEWGTLTERVRLDAGLTAVIAAVPGVAKAVGDVSFPAMTIKDEEQANGHGWPSAELGPYRIGSGTAPAQPGDVVLDAGLAERSGARVGDRIPIAVGGTTKTFRVTGVAALAGEVETTEAAMFFTPAEADALSGHSGRLDAIGVVPTAGVALEDLQRRVGDALRGKAAVLLTGDQRGLAEFPQATNSSEDLITLAAVFGGLLIIVVMFVVASTLGLSIQQRRREMALLQAIGATPGQMRRMVLGEAATIAVFATAAGCLFGPYLSGWLFDRLVGTGMVPGVVEFRQGFIPAIVAAGVSVITTLVAAMISAREATRSRPSEALVEAAAQRSTVGPLRISLALLCFAGGLALAMVTVLVMSGPESAATAGPAVLLWAIGLAFISPAVTKGLIAVFSRLIDRFSGPPGYLAMLNARARTAQMAAAVTPIMLATGMATANLYVQTTQVDAAKAAYVENLRADAVLASATGGLAPGLLDGVRRIPGVAGASEFVTSTGFVEQPYDPSQSDEGWTLQGITGDGAQQTTAVSVTAGALADLRGDTVALAARHARELGRKVGDTITMRLGDRAAVQLRIVALVAAEPDAQTVLMPADVLAAHTAAGRPPQILVRAAPGADTGELTDALTAFVAKRPDVRVTDRDALTAEYGRRQDTGAWVNYLLVAMIIAYTAISVVNTQVMGTTDRRRELALQRLTGSTPEQVMRMMGAEALLIAGVGILLGTLASMISLIPFSIAVSGTPFPSGPVWIYLTVVAFGFLLTLGATWAPTWTTMRSQQASAVLAAR